MNPINILRTFIGNGGSPQQFVQNVAVKNPIFQNLMNMASKGDTKSVEQFARNIFKEQGRDFDKEFTEFKQNFK